MKVNPFAAAALLALALSVGLAMRIHSQSQGFRHVVTQSLATTEGYDQKFIDLVTHLEEVLTTRALFPYPGGRDPMTGRRREVAASVLAVPAAVKPPSRKAAATPAPSPSPALQQEADPIRLTAIIADDYGQHTAIVMDGERSLSVDVGDDIRGRKVVRITGRDLTLEDATAVFVYGLNGSKHQQRK